jgi:hypothetical protein
MSDLYDVGNGALIKGENVKARGFYHHIIYNSDNSLVRNKVVRVWKPTGLQLRAL